MKAGQPTKYNEGMIPRVYEYIERMKKEESLPVKEELAYELGVNGDTLVEWGKKHKKFSAALKKLMESQAVVLQKGITSGNFRNPAGGIFLLKNNHGFKDKTETDITTAGKALPTPIMPVNPNVIHPNDSDS